MQKFISGKNINLRDVKISDAEFVLQLRLNPKLTRYVHAVKADLSRQIDYIKSYKLKADEWYFIVESKTKEPLGTIRIYDVQKEKNSFCWGSWIIKPSAPVTTSIESALLLYEYAFNVLNFSSAHFDVRKNNSRVIAFHKRFGAEIIGESNINYFWNYTKEDYEKVKQKYATRFLPPPP